MLKAIIFDVDGTLAETEEAHRQAFNEMFRAWGLDWFWDRKLYHKLLLVGGSRERIRHFASHYRPEGHETVVRQDENVTRMHREKTEIYTGLVSSGQTGLRPGIERLVQEALSAGVLLGIATTTNIAPLEALFRGTLGLDVLAQFKAIAAGDMVRDKKPAPDLYRLALDQLGCRPQDCLAIEDSRNGLDSALGALVPTLVTVNGYTDDQDFSGALAVMSDLGEPDRLFTGLGGFAQQGGYVSLGVAGQWHRQWQEG